MPDSIKVNDSLANLDIEATIEPYRIALQRNKIVTFPSPADMQLEDAERFMHIVATPEGRSLSEFLEAWLTPADMEKVRTAKLTLGQTSAIVKRAQAHYSAFFGDAGNSDGSDS